MARKITQRTAVIEIAVLPYRGWSGAAVKVWDDSEAALARRDALAAIKSTVTRLLDDYEIEWRSLVEIESQCEHCRAPWTEKSMTYNGGCCDEDEKANPAAQVAA